MGTVHHDRRDCTLCRPLLLRHSLVHTSSQAPCLFVIEGNGSSALRSIHLLCYCDSRCWLADSEVPQRFTFSLKNIHATHILIYPVRFRAKMV